MKTLKNPDGAIDAMKQAIDKLIDESPGTAALRLHILKKPGTPSSQLFDALDDYIDFKGVDGRFELILEEFAYP